MRDSVRSSHRGHSRKLRNLVVDDNDVLLTAYPGACSASWDSADAARKRARGT